MGWTMAALCQPVVHELGPGGDELPQQRDSLGVFARRVGRVRVVRVGIGDLRIPAVEAEAEALRQKKREEAD